MLTARMMIDTSGRCTCQRKLSELVRIEYLDLDIIRCAGSNDGTCHSLIRLTNKENIESNIDDLIHVGESEEVFVKAFIQRQAMSIVVNENCKIGNAIAANYSFIISGAAHTPNITELNIVCPNKEKLRSIISALNDDGERVKILNTRSARPNPILTEKQEDALRIAFEMGYFNTPRDSDLKKVCEYVGCSKSNLNVVLRTAVKKVVSDYLGITRKILKS